MTGSICLANPGYGFAGEILNYVDCQARAIGFGGFQALAAPGSTVSLALDTLLSMFVALFGYRMLFGEVPNLRDGTLAVAKVGIVLTLAFSWPVYQTLVVDMVLKAPAALASEIGRPAGLPGSNGELAAHIDYADREFVTLGVLGAGTDPVAVTANPSAALMPKADSPQRAPSLVDPIAMSGARIVYLIGAVGTLAGMRLIAGIMLALGPFFVALLLFEGTRDFFCGWIRALASTALGTLGTTVVLGVELAFIEPRLADLIARRNAGYPIPGASVELLVISLIFAFANVVVLITAWRTAIGFGLPIGRHFVPAPVIDGIHGRKIREQAAVSDASPPNSVGRSRANNVVDAIITMQRRDALRSRNGLEVVPHRAEPYAGHGETAPFQHQPLGRSSHRARGRILASAARRDSIK